MVCVSDVNPKEMTHSCFLVEEDSDNVVIFSLSSLSPDKPVSVNLGEEASGDTVLLVEPGGEFDPV